MKGKTWLIIGGVVVVLGLIAAGGGDKDKSSSSSDSADATSAAVQVEEEPDDTLPIKELTQAYRDNEVAAKRKYQGKTFKFKGKVTDIGEDLLGDAYVHLDYNIGVHFYFRNPDVVANLNKGDKIKLEGRIDSNLASIISVKNCKLVE